MKNTLKYVLAFILTLMTLSSVSEVSRVTQREATEWIQFTVPLPQSIKIPRKVTVDVDNIVIETNGKPDTLIQQAVEELQECPGSTTTIERENEEQFTIILEHGGPAAETLRELKNFEQAYRFIPEEEEGDSLRLVALTPRGLYYAGKTLQQLLKAKLKNGKARVPLAEITDYPDIEDRGLWGSDSFNHLRWMSDRKMNHDEQLSYTGIDPEKNCVVKLHGNKPRILQEGPIYGINPVPVVLHLDQIYNKGLFDAYPKLKANGGDKGAICYSNPVFTDILASWLVLLGQKKGVTEVDVWMAENLHGKGGCRCKECRKVNRDILELRTILAAWNKARGKLPKLGLRILTSEETDDSNRKILKLLPREVKLWYYHSLFTYNTTHNPIIPSYLVKYSKEGRWIGVCCNLCASVLCWQPMTSASFIHYRMNEFADKNISGVLGYAVPRLYHGFFNVEAAAEWSWNADGRSPREFALSRAIRQGYTHPQKFAEWSETLGRVEWILYGSGFPAQERRKRGGSLAQKLSKGNIPEFGNLHGEWYGLPWGEIKSPEHLDELAARAEHCVGLARELEIPQFVHESLIVKEYITALQSLCTLRTLVTPNGILEKNRQPARTHFLKYIDSLARARAQLRKWEATLPHKPANEHLVERRAVKVLNEMIEEMKAVAEKMGVKLNHTSRD